MFRVQDPPPPAALPMTDAEIEEFLSTQPPPPQPRSLGRTLARRTGFAVWITGCIAAGLASRPLVQDFVHPAKPEYPPSKMSEDEKIVRTLMAQNDCWTGPAPADMKGKVPGGVIYTLKGKGEHPAMGGPEGVDLALAQLFDKDSHVSIFAHIHAFCRDGGPDY